jgi:hypothetical protein
MNVILQTVLFRQYKKDANIYDVIMQNSDCDRLEKTLFSCFLCDYCRRENSLLDVDYSLCKTPNNTPLKRKSKFQIFRDIIWKHPFLSEEEKERLLLFFCKIQRIYHAFIRLKNIWVFTPLKI